MNRMERPNRTLRAAGAAFALVTATALTGAAAAPSTSSPTQKLHRQIGVMEKVIDQVLVDSPNFRVTSRAPSHGVYLEEFGALFTVETSLVSGDWGEWPWGKIKDEDHEAPEAKEAEKDRALAEEDRLLADKQRDFVTKGAKDQEERYDKGKEELVDTLLDYGETLTTLRDDQWIAIAAFVDEMTLVDTRPATRVVLKVRMKDLRAATAGTLSAEDVRARVTMEEY